MLRPSDSAWLINKCSVTTAPVMIVGRHELHPAKALYICCCCAELLSGKRKLWLPMQTGQRCGQHKLSAAAWSSYRFSGFMNAWDFSVLWHDAMVNSACYQLKQMAMRVHLCATRWWNSIDRPFCLVTGLPWTSILVRTGIFRRPAGQNDPDHPADFVVQDVLKAVDAALHRTRQSKWHQMR